jgi:glycosyltransferase involved in cell wall biosynthesis
MTYERPQALNRCLESIVRLAAPKSTYEVIVVDDGSVAHPPVPLEQRFSGLNLRYHWIPHRGIAAARNAGLALASGDLVAFVADDYTLPPDYLSRAEWFFQAYTEAQVLTFNVSSVGPAPARHVQQLYHELVLLQNAGATPDENDIIRTFHLPASRAAVFKRQLFDRVGPFDERLAAGEDGELGQRLAALGIPLHFMHRYYIDHYEMKGLRDFLRQRREYATSYFALTVASQAPSASPVWSLARCVRMVIGRLYAWVGISYREQKLLRFALLWPALAVFLFRFYCTLHQLERAALRARSTAAPQAGSRTRRPSRTGERRVFSRLRKALNAATRFPGVRRVTLGIIGALVWLSARLLSGLDSVASVHVRGSYGRSDFRPFISDIDFAIAVRSRRGSSYETCRELHRRLRIVRFLNPFVRDAWQTILPEPQWPLVARYGWLFGTGDWRLVAGEEPWRVAGRTDQRLLLAAWWNRQHLWTRTAMCQALRGQTSLRALEGSLKKARFYADRISAQVSSDPLDVAGALRGLDRSAAQLMEQLDLARARTSISPDCLGAATPTALERRALLEIGAAIDLKRGGTAVIGTEDLMVLVSDGTWSDDEYRKGLEVLRQVYRTTGLLTFVYSRRAFALAPLMRRLRILEPGVSLGDAGLRAQPLLVEEQLLYQSLYLATNLWVAAGRLKDTKGLEHHVINVLEASEFFLTGTMRREDRDLRATLTVVESLDLELRSRLQQSRALHRPPRDAIGIESKELFELGAIASERLAEILLASDAHPRHDRATVA